VSQFKHEWYQYKCKTLRQEGAAQFDKLAAWIEEQAAIARCETAHAPALAAAAVFPASTSVAPPQNAPPATSNVAPLQTNTPPAPSQNQENWNRGRVWCVVCKVNQHPTYACETLSQNEFQSLTPKAQRDTVKGECFICLGRLKHKMKDCSDKGPACRGCRQRHDPRLKCNPPKQDSSPSSWGRNPRNSNAA
jgi:hypothetical protein